MTTINSTEQEFLELVNRYPSPHNGQPIRLRRTSPSTFIMYFEKSRGLQATDISYIFSFVTIGVFTTYVNQCAIALGHIIEVKTSLPSVETLKGEGLVEFGQFTIEWGTANPNNQMLDSLQFRQTSRKKYTSGVPKEVADQLIKSATSKGMQLTQLTKPQTKQAIWLNQRAVFDDMHDEAVRQELDHWLRYSQKQKQLKMDGLAYDCMELNGRTMKYIVNHPGILRKKFIASFLKKYYLRTMSDNSDVFYMLAPFATEQDSYNVGTVIMDLWMQMSQHKLYLHPFGTIMSNHAAHADFIQLAQVTNESREQSYLVFIFRGGSSSKPVPSLRIPYQKHLLISEQA